MVALESFGVGCRVMCDVGTPRSNASRRHVRLSFFLTNKAHMSYPLWSETLPAANGLVRVCDEAVRRILDRDPSHLGQ
jgi:hypothetical protein